METVFAELKRYVGFAAADEAALRALHPLLAPFFPRIAEVFYDRILTHEEARQALERGESSVGTLKVKLVAWMEVLFQGPWDDEYYALRSRIGRVHVQIALPQHYMFGAMNVLRREMSVLVDQLRELDAAQRTAAHAAVNRILDLELAIMLHTYREDLVASKERAERLSTFGQLAGTIGHELRNPLGVIESSVYILRGRVGSDERTLKHLDRIGDQVTISNRIINTLLDLIRDRPLDRGRIALEGVLATAREAVTVPEGVTLEVVGLDGLPELEGDAAQLRQAFLNLLENAVQAVGATGTVRVTGAREGTTAVVRVEDSGPGIAAAVRARLFEPLVTTRAGGIGLGLAFVRRIVERHGGTVACDARGALGGARFVVRLPLGASGA